MDFFFSIWTSIDCDYTLNIPNVLPYSWTSLFASVEVPSNEPVVTSPQGAPISGSSAETRPPGPPVDTGFFSWIPAYIRLT